MAGPASSSSGASSSDVTMSTLSGGASTRSRSDFAGYRPSRGRSSRAAVHATAPAPYYDRLRAIEDRDVESGLDSEADLNVGRKAGAIMSYHNKMVEQQRAKDSIIAMKESQLVAKDSELQQLKAQPTNQPTNIPNQ